MKKYKIQKQTTDDSSVYNKLLHQEFDCTRCRANHGCNSNYRHGNPRS